MLLLLFFQVAKSTGTPKHEWGKTTTHLGRKETYPAFVTVQQTAFRKQNNIESELHSAIIASRFVISRLIGRVSHGGLQTIVPLVDCRDCIHFGQVTTIFNIFIFCSYEFYVSFPSLDSSFMWSSSESRDTHAASFKESLKMFPDDVTHGVIRGFSWPVTLSLTSCAPLTRFHFILRFWNQTFTWNSKTEMDWSNQDWI